MKNQDQNQQNKRELIGGCHCGQIRFNAVVDEASVILHCNCSICDMTGFAHLIVPHTDFTLIQGEEHLHSYRFNTNQANHLFCDICGIKSFYQPRSHPDCWSVHAHCLDGYDPDQWQHQTFDGRNWEAAHKSVIKDHG